MNGMQQPQQQEPMTRPMSQSFRDVPVNPYQERAAAVRQQVQQMEADRQQQAATTQPPMQGTVTSQTMAPPPVQPAAQPLPSTGQGQQVGPATPPPPQPAQQNYYPDPVMLQRMQQMEQERQYLMQENAAQRDAIERLYAANQEYDALRQRAELQASITDESFGDLSTVDTEDAKAISRAVLNATQSALAPIYQELRRTQLLVDQRAGQQQERMERDRLLSLRERVIAAHPDFDDIQRTPEYKQYMKQRDGLSSQTRDQRAAQEFRAGNTEYVIDMLRQYKANVPSVQSIQTVAPVQAAAGSPATVMQQQPTLTLHDLNNLYHTGQITAEKYRELKPQALQAWRDAGQHIGR